MGAGDCHMNKPFTSNPSYESLLETYLNMPSSQETTLYERQEMRRFVRWLDSCHRETRVDYSMDRLWEIHRLATRSRVLPEDIEQIARLSKGAVQETPELVYSKDALRYSVLSGYIEPRVFYDKLVKHGKSPGEWKNLGDMTIRQKIDELCDAVIAAETATD